MEMMIIGFLNPVLEKEWNLTMGEKALFGSTVFISWGVGNLICSLVTDRVGRILPVKISVIGVFVSGLLSALSQNFYQLLTMRVILCIFIGISTPIFTPLVSEITPAHDRGKRNVLMNSAFTLGEYLTVGIAYLTMKDIDEGNWRLLVFCCAMTLIFPLVTILFWGYESPRFLLLKGQFESAVEVLNKIGTDNDKNYKPLSLEELEQLRAWTDSKIRGQKGQKVGLGELFSENLAALTSKLSLIWFSLAFLFYAIVFELPTILQKMNDSEEETKQMSKNEMYLNIVLQVTVEIPITVIAYLMIESKTYGRKITMLLSFVICSLGCLAIFFLEKRYFFEILCLVKGSASLAFIIIYPYTAELYSTLVRTTSSAFLSMICRIGGILMPWIINYMFRYGIFYPFLSMAIMSTISAISNSLLGHDTTSQRLDESFHQEDEDDSLLNQKIKKSPSKNTLQN